MGNVSLRIANSPYLAPLTTVAVGMASLALSGTLLLPLLVSLLLGCAVYLAQAAHTRMLQFQAINVLLENEIARCRRFEQELREKQFYTRSLIESSIDALSTIDPAGIITDVNQQMENLTGYKREELIGTPFGQYFTNPQRAADGVELVMREERVSNYELVARHREGRETVVACNASLFSDAEGKLQGVFAAARDITDRKRAEGKLREQTAQQAAVAELGQKALATFDLRELLEDASTRLTGLLSVQYCTVLELQPNGREFLLRAGVGWEPSLIGTAMIHSGMNSQAGYTLAGNTPVVVEDLRSETRFRPAPLLLQHGVVSGLSVIIRAAGRTYGVLGVYTSSLRHFTLDETNLVQAFANLLGLAIARRELENQLLRFTAELQRSNEELQDFASIASHDLQEPLRKITSFGERLRGCCAAQLDDSGRDYLMRMENATRRMSLLIDDLLQYSRVSTKAQPFEPVDLQETVVEVLVDLEARLQEAHAEVEILSLPVIQADRSQMRALLQNLLSNAAKFHVPGVAPRIRVEGCVDDGWCELRVSDNGIGFEEKYLDNIFRPFHRLHSRAEFDGTGMGLAICRKIVSRHGGTITARSKQGEGSEFIVRLPSRPQPEGITCTGSRDPAPLSSSRKTMTTTTS